MHPCVVGLYWYTWLPDCLSDGTKGHTRIYLVHKLKDFMDFQRRCIHSTSDIYLALRCSIFYIKPLSQSLLPFSGFRQLIHLWIPPAQSFITFVIFLPSSPLSTLSSFRSTFRILFNPFVPNYLRFLFFFFVVNLGVNVFIFATQFQHSTWS